MKMDRKVSVAAAAASKVKKWTLKSGRNVIERRNKNAKLAPV